MIICMMAGEFKLTFAQGWEVDLVTTECSNSSQDSATPGGDVEVLSRVSKPVDADKLATLESSLEAHRFATLPAIVVAGQCVTDGTLKVLHGYPVLEPGEARVRKDECLLECELAHDGETTTVYFHATNDWQLSQVETKLTYSVYQRVFHWFNLLNLVISYYISEGISIANFPEPAVAMSHNVKNLSLQSKLDFLVRLIEAVDTELLNEHVQWVDGGVVKGVGMTIEELYRFHSRLFGLSKKMELPAPIDVPEHIVTPAF